MGTAKGCKRSMAASGLWCRKALGSTVRALFFLALMDLKARHICLCRARTWPCDVMHCTAWAELRAFTHHNNNTNDLSFAPCNDPAKSQERPLARKI